MSYRFWLKTDARIGIDASLEAVKYIKEKGYKNVAVIIDKGVLTNTQSKKLIRQLKKTNAKIGVYPVEITEADYDFLENFRKNFKPGIDLFIGIGGGSILDVTKAMSVLLVNKRPALEYRGFGKITKAGPSIIAIPTTAGSGSEVTPNASFIDKKEMKKMGINTDLYLPVLALIDPLLSVTCPTSVTVGSGMDALIHALEGYTSKIATPISKIFSKEAIKIMLRDLPLIIKEPTNLQLRENLSTGSLLAGIAMINSSGSLTAALSYPLGVHFNVPHGTAGAVYLAKALRLNLTKGAIIYHELADLLPYPVSGTKKQKAEKFVSYIENMSKKLGIPDDIKDYGVTSDDLPMLTDELMTFTGALAQNPVEITREDVVKFMLKMI